MGLVHYMTRILQIHRASCANICSCFKVKQLTQALIHDCPCEANSLNSHLHLGLDVYVDHEDHSALHIFCRRIPEAELDSGLEEVQAILPECQPRPPPGSQPKAEDAHWVSGLISRPGDFGPSEKPSPINFVPHAIAEKQGLPCWCDLLRIRLYCLADCPHICREFTESKISHWKERHTKKMKVHTLLSVTKFLWHIFTGPQAYHNQVPDIYHLIRSKASVRVEWQKPAWSLIHN